MYYVYLIERVSVQGERYLGMTTDLKERLQEHNAENLPYFKIQAMEADHLHRVY